MSITYHDVDDDFLVEYKDKVNNLTIQREDIMLLTEIAREELEKSAGIAQILSDKLKSVRNIQFFLVFLLSKQKLFLFNPKHFFFQINKTSSCLMLNLY